MKKEFCPVVKTVNIIGKKWVLMIIYYLTKGEKRFNELKANLDGISSKTLSLSLSDLTRAGIVKRDVYPDSPIRAVYSLTQKGKELEKVMHAMRAWGECWVGK